MGELCAGGLERHPSEHQLELRVRRLENAALLQGSVYRSTETLSGQWVLAAQVLAVVSASGNGSASVNGNHANAHGRRGLEIRSGHRVLSVSHESENGHASEQPRHWMNGNGHDDLLHESVKPGWLEESANANVSDH